MKVMNHTSFGSFILLGLSNVLYLKAIFFFLFLLMYLMTLSGNLLLITVVRINPKLQTPMYFFLSNLSIIDISFSSTIVPKILISTIIMDSSISMLGCAAQMYFHLAFGSTECIILAIMAYDRFAAICRPLHYNTIMSKRICSCLALGSWSVSFMNSAIHVVLTFYLPYCPSYHIHHFFCEIPVFLRTACQDTWVNEIGMYIGAGLIAMCSFILILISYVQIVATILNIRSSQGRQKAFSTCGSHLTVLLIYYGTIMSVYLRPLSAYSPETDKTVSILYTAVTPMLNPIVYSIRNQKVKDTIKRKQTKIKHSDK